MNLNSFFLYTEITSGKRASSIRNEQIKGDKSGKLFSLRHLHVCSKIKHKRAKRHSTNQYNNNRPINFSFSKSVLVIARHPPLPPPEW
ncbi:hypothetical protein CEXT_185271 [Caerostris extrusa]|uniref:Uncharacterized protein n=1 Tax=Caerostris extrusa TaxID=172846 RepID=A0AAV4XNL5_CAEEX|nr:hypothetical protein CEXT_185271 [Caerostris extrusa]